MWVLVRNAQVVNDHEKAQSEKDSHSKKPRWGKTIFTIRYLYHEPLCRVLSKNINNIKMFLMKFSDLLDAITDQIFVMRGINQYMFKWSVWPIFIYFTTSYE